MALLLKKSNPFEALLSYMLTRYVYCTPRITIKRTNRHFSDYIPLSSPDPTLLGAATRGIWGLEGPDTGRPKHQDIRFLLIKAYSYSISQSQYYPL